MSDEVDRLRERILTLERELVRIRSALYALPRDRMRGVRAEARVPAISGPGASAEPDREAHRRIRELQAMTRAFADDLLRDGGD